MDAGYARLANRPSTSATSPPAARTPRYPTRSGYASPGAYSQYTLGSTAADRVGCLTAVKMSAGAKVQRYFKRLTQVRQMDFEFAGWQMLYLLAHPQKVYRNFIYRKRTKDQFARDDPAFLVLMAAALFLSSVFFAFALGLSLWGFVKFFLWVVLVDCIGVGCLVASILWFVSNRWMRRTTEHDVEWGYCFDVHLNAFFPFLVLLHVLLPIIYTTLIDSSAFLPRLLGNTIWAVAAVYYVYITFLGYTALPFLHRVQYLLYPITFLFIFYVASVTAGWNISQTAMSFYHLRAETHNLGSATRPAPFASVTRGL